MRRLYSALAVSLLAALAGCVNPQNAPAGSVFDDENIEKDAIARINSGHSGRVHVNVASLNHRLLLTGEVPSEASKAEIERLVAPVPRLRAINNELVVGEISGVAARTSDSWITSDIKRRLRNSNALDSGKIRVVAENGSVFLMGTVHRKEGAAAAEIASTTNKVQRVVLVFEYLD